MAWTFFYKQRLSDPREDAIPLRSSAFPRNLQTQPVHQRAARFTDSRRRWLGRFPTGWKGSIVTASILATTILMLNLAITIWAANTRTSNPIDAQDGIRTIYDGSCGNSKNIIIAVHFAINVLAALLLAASTNCMQILISPQRQEVEKAHASRRWLCIGVPNLKNFLFVSWPRRVLWSILFISSLPLHLLWNSVFVQTLAHNNYIMGAVSEEFEFGAPVVLNGNNSDLTAWVIGGASVIERDWLSALRDGNPDKLDVHDCILAYGDGFTSQYSNLALVMDYQHAANSLLKAATFQIDSRGHMNLDWVCGIPDPSSGCNPHKLAATNSSYWIPFTTKDGCGLSAIACEPMSSTKSIGPSQSSSNRTLNSVPVKHCLAYKTHRGCRVGVVMTIMYIVVIANAFKVLGIFLTLFVFGKRSHDQPLVTTGDAIESFIRSPDPHTHNRCLWSTGMLKSHPHKFWTPSTTAIVFTPQKPRRWCRGAPLSSWLALFVPAVASISVINYLYVRNSLSSYMHLGFGGVSPQQLVWFKYPWDLDHGATNSTLLANTPQIILSYMYCAYNAIATRMLAQAEILKLSSSYIRSRRNKFYLGWLKKFKETKSHRSAGSAGITQHDTIYGRGLRVSNPIPGTQQRSTYYLQLPYRYALSLIAASALLHWSVSQSFFLVRVSVFQTNGFEDPSALISTVGYSAYSIVVAQAILVFMLVAVALLALLRRYDGSDMMPLVAGCSATLAAVTQPGNSTRVGDQHFKEAMEEKCLVWGTPEAVTQSVEDVDNFGDSTREQHVTSEEELDRRQEVDVDQEGEISGNVEPTMAKPIEHATFFDAKADPLIMGIAYA